MTSTTTSVSKTVATTPKKVSALPNTDTYSWVNPYGGSWAVSNWTDAATGATGVPGATNAVSITGGTTFTNITGTGAAAQLSITNDVLLWGTTTVGGAVTLMGGSNFAGTDLELDGGASLTAGSLNLGGSALGSAFVQQGGNTLEVDNGSSLVVSGSAMLAGSNLMALAGSTIKLGGLIANGGNTIAVDDNSSMEIGATGGAALGAVTIDKGVSAPVSGTIYGNVVVNGTLGVQAGGSLGIDCGLDPFGNAQSIGGSGTLVLSENSSLSLGVADSAAIQFNGPAGTLNLSVLPTGTITGFVAGDVISLNGGLATGLSYVQTTASVATLTLTKGGKAAGKLTLAGNYTGNLFHLSLSPYGYASITLQTIGIAPTQPNLITGTAGSDILSATANNQILTGLGGNDTLAGGTFTGISFKDTSADLSGSTVNNFGVSDTIDLTDMKLSTVVVSYAPGAGVLTVTDGTHSAVIGLPSSSYTPSGMPVTLPIGYFAASTDGATGTNVKYIAISMDAYAFSAALGGGYGLASNWRDTTTNTAATAAPSYGNAVTIAGGTGFTDITGSGVAASLATTGSVLMSGSLTVGSQVSGVSGALAQSGTLALDSAANLAFSGQAQINGLVEVVGASKLTAAGGVVFGNTGSSLLVVGGSTAQFANIGAFSTNIYPSRYAASVIGVDTTSSIEIGTAGNVTKGALTIDSGVTANLSGTIDGSVVVNGTLALAGSLAINAFGAAAETIGGTGTIEIMSGDTLTLAGSDSAAIQFYQPGYSGATETLALMGNLPTGTISGFAAGDVITVAKTVTGLGYSQTGSTGTLTLLNGSTAIGKLSLAGSYTASQFQVQLSGAGQSSTITYSPTPGTIGGNTVSANTDAYSWTNTSGGVWGNAGNWSDTTTGKVPTASAGAGNAVTVADYNALSSGSGAQIISGSGAAASLTVSTSAVFTGSLAVSGAFNDYGAVSLSGGAIVSAGSLSLNGSGLQVGGGSSLKVSGNASIWGNMGVVGASTVQVTGGVTACMINGGTIAVDGTSSLEFGSTGTAAKGALTVDSGQGPTLNGATIAAKLVVNGSLTFQGGKSIIEGFGGTVGAISGSGTIGLSGYGSPTDLVLNATDSAAIAFQWSPSSIYNPSPGPAPILELAGPLPTGTISGFVAGDTIQVDRTVTGVSFKQTTVSQGTLTLTNGASTVGTLSLSGTYSTSLFHVDTAAATGVATISLQTQTSASGSGAASKGTDAYNWVGAGGGSWSTASNWMDTTTHTAPSTVAGGGDAVVISGLPASGSAIGQYLTIGGSGSAASLAVNGDVLLTGSVTVAGQLIVAPAPSQTVAALALDSGATLTAASAAISGTLSVGHGSSATIAGTATLTGASLLALDGSSLQLGALIGNASNNVIAIDANSSVRIGKPTTFANGSLTEAAGATAAFAGTIYGSVVANGTLAVAGGGSLFIDLNGGGECDPYATALPTISGTGTLSLAEGSTLGLGVADSVAIQFAGPNAVLQLAAIPTATITGFAASDLIRVNQTVTGATYKQGSTAGTLTLTNGASTVGTLNLAGAYGINSVFHLDFAVDGSSAVISLQSIGIAVQPALIQATPASDILTATANNQTLTGSGGGDIMSGGAFTGIDFKDSTANLNGSVLRSFLSSDMIDFTDMTASKAAVTYAGGVMSITDGTHKAALGVSFLSTPSSGGFAVASDGAAGTKVFWHA